MSDQEKLDLLTRRVERVLRAAGACEFYGLGDEKLIDLEWELDRLGDAFEDCVGIDPRRDLVERQGVNRIDYLTPPDPEKLNAPKKRKRKAA